VRKRLSELYGQPALWLWATAIAALVSYLSLLVLLRLS
jgi:hypothetical protein